MFCSDDWGGGHDSADIPAASEVTGSEFRHGCGAKPEALYRGPLSNRPQMRRMTSKGIMEPFSPGNWLAMEES